ncbi:MAG: hypothetical protein QM725_05765 [Lacibacter sp.]
MATYQGPGFNGKIDNLVFFTRNGKQVVRTMPGKVRQTAATKIRSRNFGIASSSCKTLRWLLQPVLFNPTDRNMQLRFSGAVARWLAQSNAETLAPQQQIPFVTGFSFSKQTSVAERCRLPFTVSNPVAGQTLVQLPAFIPTATIAAPAHTNMVQLTITVAACHLLNARAAGSETKQLLLPYNNTPVAAQDIEFNVAAETGVLLITAVQILYRLQNGNTDMRDEFMPASVVDGRYG